MRVLWLARNLPFPLVTGDKIYTAKMAEALAAAGAQITFAGYPSAAPAEPVSGIAWHPVPGGPKNNWRAALDPRPLVAARHLTKRYRKHVGGLAASAWDAVVIDQYGMGWVLDQRRRFQTNPSFVFLTHDHEESVTALQAKDPGASSIKRAYLWQNHLKTRWFERWIARRCDLLTTITEADAALFRQTAPDRPSIVLTPGYSGRKLSERTVSAETARAVVLFGSYRWSAKLANLTSFLEQAAPALARSRIELRIVGDIADDVRQALAARYPSVNFTGFVADPGPYLDARLAILAEPIGGGFKLKLLDYVFNRLPVAALDVCAAGLPPEISQHMMLFGDTATLLRRVVAEIDDVQSLDRRQRLAFTAAESAFDWADRGRSFLDALEATVRSRGFPSPAALETAGA